MPSDESLDWLLQLHEEQGPTLHRLVVLLGAEQESGWIVRSALLALYRRSNRVIDPVERIEFLHEHVVHLARAVRPPQGQIALPEVPDTRQAELLGALSALPPRSAELLIVGHYLGSFGPELAGIMRMSLRGCNQRLEASLQALRARVGDPVPGSLPGAIESLSQELTAALRSAGRQVAPPGTETLEGELAQLADGQGTRIGPRLAGVLTLAAVALGLILAGVTRPIEATVGNPVASPTVVATAAASHQIPAQVRNVPLYFVGRQDDKLYRETRSLPASDHLLRSALESLLTIVPRDPDYESAWGGGQVLAAELVGDTLTVDLSADAYEELTSAVRAKLARDQVVYTASELIGEPALKVRFLQDGAAPPREFVTEEGFGRTGLDPMPAVWVSSPLNSDEVGSGIVVFQGTVKTDVGEPVVSITNSDTKQKITEVSAQTSLEANAEGWRVWSVSVTLEPGNYEVRAAVTSGDPPVTISENKSIKVS